MRVLLTQKKRMMSKVQCGELGDINSLTAPQSPPVSCPIPQLAFGPTFSSEEWGRRVCTLRIGVRREGMPPSQGADRMCMCQDSARGAFIEHWGARVPEKNLRLRAAAPMTERINTQAREAVGDLSSPNNVTSVSNWPTPTIRERQYYVLRVGNKIHSFGFEIILTWCHDIHLITTLVKSFCIRGRGVDIIRAEAVGGANLADRLFQRISCCTWEKLDFVRSSEGERTGVWVFTPSQDITERGERLVYCVLYCVQLYCGLHYLLCWCLVCHVTKLPVLLIIRQGPVSAKDTTSLKVPLSVNNISDK